MRAQLYTLLHSHCYSAPFDCICDCHCAISLCSTMHVEMTSSYKMCCNWQKSIVLFIHTAFGNVSFIIKGEKHSMLFGMFCTYLWTWHTCGRTPLGVSFPKAGCRCFDGESSLYCSLSKTLMIPAWKPISGTSKDQLAQAIMPEWRGYILKPAFQNHCHYHTDVRRIFLFFFL